METQYTAEQFEKLAEFMKVRESQFVDADTFREHIQRYGTSMDMLFEVVDKIEATGFNTRLTYDAHETPNRSFVIIGGSSGRVFSVGKGDSRREAILNAIIPFMDWFKEARFNGLNPIARKLAEKDDERGVESNRQQTY